MDRLKKKRGSIRTSFTKTRKNVLDALQSDSLDSGLLKDKLTRLEGLMAELKEVDDMILDLLLDEDVGDEIINSEREGTESYLEEFITTKRLITECVCKSKTVVGTEGNRGSSDEKRMMYRLPKIELAKFDGQLINWLPFWAQFKKIHEDEQLDACDKFQYLLQCMEHGTRARECLEGFPLTKENYLPAINALEQRFGKKELLMEVYVRELLKLIIVNVQSKEKNKLPLSKLHDKLEAYLRSLETMGIDFNVNSPWLYPMVESCLSEEVLKAWQRRYNTGTDGSQETINSSRLSRLMKFLKEEVDNEERFKLARSGFQDIDFRDEIKDKIKKYKDPCLPTAAGLFTGQVNPCIFCNKGHESKDCWNARSLPLEKKRSIVKEKKRCLKCLKPNHIAKQCKSFVCCYKCGKGHFIILCPDLSDKKDVIDSSETLQSTIAKPQCTKEVALMTLYVKLLGPKGSKVVRVLLDSGSQKSYILGSTARYLGLESTGIENISHTLFGGTHIKAKLHKKYKITLCCTKYTSDQTIAFECLEQETICGKIPRVPKEKFCKILKRNKIWLSDIGTDCPEIEVLIGSNIYGSLLTGRVKQLDEDLTAIETKLGWTVCGLTGYIPGVEKINNFTQVVNNLALRDLKVSDLWRLETIGIEHKEISSKGIEEEVAQDRFMKSLTRKEDGRYCVKLPWLNKKDNIPSNRHIAEKRLFSATKRLISMDKYLDYDQVFKECLGVVEIVPKQEIEMKCHYLPHHPVIKENSLTTKIRPVFDASCKIRKMSSLNECVMKITEPKQWHFVPSTLNSAVLPSRGCNSKHLIEKRWWEGPEWLKKPEEEWPKSDIFMEGEIISSIYQKGCMLFTVTQKENLLWYENISRFSKIVNVFAWILRFINNSRKRNVRNNEDLLSTERQEAENFMWKTVQQQSFCEKNNSTNGLCIVKDQTRLIRLKTKIIERDEEESFQYSMVLPAKHHIITCLITEYHLKNCHAGVNIMTSLIREYYWIISARRSIRGVVTKCVKCKRFTSKRGSAPPIHLPIDRIKDASIFEIDPVADASWWERLIGLVKALLLRVLGRSLLKYEELVTLICEVEALTNRRPLTYISGST